MYTVKEFCELVYYIFDHTIYSLESNSRSTVQRQYQSGVILWFARARNNDLNLK